MIATEKKEKKKIPLKEKAYKTLQLELYHMIRNNKK